MKNKFIKNKLLPIIVLIILVLGVLFLLKSTKTIQNPIGSQPAVFNLIFRYGVGAKNELNTFDQTFTKDMITEPSITTKFSLTESELAGIYQEINELKLFDKTEEPQQENVYISPCSSYYLKVQINSTQKELSWDNCSKKISDKLQNFTDYIISIIQSKEQYKKLPQPKSGYI